MCELPDGIHVALITPCDHDGHYLPTVMETIVEAAMPFVQGLSILGSTGEGPTLTPRSQREVIQHLVRVNQGRLPLSCGVVARSATEYQQALHALDDEGIDFGLILPPLYYPLTPPEVVDFYRAVADGSPIPIIIYHIPQFTKVQLMPEQVATLADHPRIVGLKDSGMNFGFFQRVRYATSPQFKVFTGSDELLAAVAAVGGNGAICASPNVAPHLSSMIWQALVQQQSDPQLEQQKTLMRLIDTVRELGGLRAWKTAVELKHLGVAQPLPPLRPLVDADRQRLMETMQDLHLIARSTVLPSAQKIGL